MMPLIDSHPPSSVHRNSNFGSAPACSLEDGLVGSGREIDEGIGLIRECNCVVADVGSANEKPTFDRPGECRDSETCFAQMFAMNACPEACK